MIFLLPSLNSSPLLLVVVPFAFFSLLFSYWIYDDGRKIEILIQHLGVKEKVTEEMNENLVTKEEKSKSKVLAERCGNCTSYLTAKCPRQYANDSEVWRTQYPCDLYQQKN
jgi:hypothetical protein